MEAVRAVVEPVVVSLDLEVFDLTIDGRTLQLTVDREGGVDLDALTTVTQAVSAALDAADQSGPDLGAGSYSLEVSSPGLERPLRTPTHFRRAVGATVSIKTAATEGGGDPLRHRGVLSAPDDDSCTVAVDGSAIQIAYDSIVAARTVFEWGPAPKPGSGGRQKKRAKKKVATR
ncbi:MAG: ribosome maturation factor RimP [Acidimicrobiia bacterium]